jgi:hypothetical protein
VGDCDIVAAKLQLIVEDAEFDVSADADAVRSGVTVRESVARPVVEDEVVVVSVSVCAATEARPATERSAVTRWEGACRERTRRRGRWPRATPDGSAPPPHLEKQEEVARGNGARGDEQQTKLRGKILISNATKERRQTKSDARTTAPAAARKRAPPPASSSMMMERHA